MKKNQLVVVFFFILLSCNKNPKSESNSFRINFNAENAKTLKISDSKNLVNSISLEMSGKSLVAQNDIFAADKNNFFFLSRTTGKVIRFSRQGKLMNTIGNIGKAPEEYIEPADLYIDEKSKHVEIMSYSGISVYDYNGNFIQKNSKKDIPAFSFAKDNKKNYWLSTGNNIAYSEYKLFRINRDNIIEKFNQTKESLLPMIEKNLTMCPGGLITYTESLSDRVFTIKDNQITETYQIDFGDYKLPSEDKRVDAQKFFELMRKSNFCQIKNYYENDDFSYFFIIQNLNSKRELNFFHLFIRKVNKEKYLYKVENQNMNSFLYYPKGITPDNKLILVGEYNNVSSINENPNIVFLSIDNLLHDK